jgi:IclR family acetate operon transcriptional repressor
MTEPIEPASQKAAHNQSVMRAVAIIRCFLDSPDGATLSELSRRTGTHVSTVHRILQTLTAGGVLRRDESNERYFPGTVLLALAGATFSSSGFGSASQVLGAVAERTGESVSLGIRDVDCVVVLLVAESSNALRFGHRAGSRVPLHASSMGKALIAFGGRPAEVELAGLDHLERLTPRTIVRAGALGKDIAATVERGYAVSDGEMFVGVRSIAVPVASGSGPAAVALGLQGPAARFTAERDAELVAVLRETAEVLARLPMLANLEANSSPRG